MKPEPNEVVRKQSREVGRWIPFFVGCTLFVHAPLAVSTELHRAFVASAHAAPTSSPGRLISVPLDGTLKSALASAQQGDIIELQGGAATPLPNEVGATWIHILSSSPGAAANSQRRVYSVVPSAPAASSDVALAVASQFDYDALLGLYSRGPAALHLQSPTTNRSGSGGARPANGRGGWPMRGNDSANTGHTTALGPALQTGPAWTFQPDASTFVWRPAIAPDGTIYVTTVLFSAGAVDGRLYALRPDGSVKWQTQLTNSSGLNVWSSATPVVDRDGNIYVAWAHDLGFGSLTAISLDSSGNVRWRFEPNIELENASHQQPVLGQRVLYAAADTSFFFNDTTHRASIFALDLATGTPVWHWVSPNLDTFFDGPAVGRDGLYHASASNSLRGASGHLYRIRPDGELDWSVDIGVGVNQAPPTVDAQNNLYIGDGSGVVFKYSSAGAQRWAYDTLSGQIYMSPVLNGTRVTVGGADGLHVLDLVTGERGALFAPGEYPFGQASDRAGNAFFYSFNLTGSVFGFGRGGRQWWTFDTGLGSSVNAIAIAGDGKLLVGNGQSLQAYVAPVLGDLNCNGAVSALDFGPFVLAATDPARYAQRYPQCHRSLADVNGDGAIDTFDLVPFLGLID